MYKHSTSIHTFRHLISCAQELQNYLLNPEGFMQDLQAAKLLSEQQTNSSTDEKAALLTQLDQMQNRADLTKAAECAKQLSDLASEHSARKVPSLSLSIARCRPITSD